MVSVFWDVKGILLIEHMKKSLGEVYKEIIGNTKTAIQQRRLHNCDRKIMLLYDNCKVHEASQVCEVIINECGFAEMEYPPYSPDLALIDYYFFPKLKKHVGGRRLFRMNT